VPRTIKSRHDQSLRDAVLPEKTSAQVQTRYEETKRVELRAKVMTLMVMLQKLTRTTLLVVAVVVMCQTGQGKLLILYIFGRACGSRGKTVGHDM
jgi:hypothetical protein